MQSQGQELGGGSARVHHDLRQIHRHALCHRRADQLELTAIQPDPRARRAAIDHDIENHVLRHRTAVDGTRLRGFAARPSPRLELGLTALAGRQPFIGALGSSVAAANAFLTEE